MQESYNTWVDEVDNTIKQVEKIKIKTQEKPFGKSNKREKC